MKLAQDGFSEGKNAGVRVTVELVNARSHADMLGDGFSQYTSSGNKATARNLRRVPSPRVGPATQLTNNTTSDRGPLSCNVEYGSLDIRPYCPRTDLMANQWKTLYKVTVKGMMTKDLNVSMVYDYTQKPVLWNAGSAPASKVEVKESSVFRGHNDFSKAMNWRDRSYSKEDDAICVANGLAAGWNRYGMWDAQHGVKCSTIVAEDMANDQEAGNDGNIHFVLKDGYKDPQLWTYYNRTQWAPCDDPRNNACTFKHKSSGQWWYQWNYADIDALNRDANSGKIPTATATAFKIDADTIKTPLVVMKDDNSNAKATDKTAADSRVAPDQWRMQNEQNTFAAPTVDKAAKYYIKLNGDVPDPQDGKAFTGYKLQGITAAGSVEPLLKNRVFYPGDAIDLRAVGADGQPLVKLSNSSFDAARYAELQLVPTFGAESNGHPKMYDVKYVVRALDGRKRELDKKAFSFYAAPGLTASIDEASWSPADNPPEDYKTYVYQPKESSHTNKVFSESDSRYTSNVLKLLYASTDRQVNINAEIQPITNGYSGLDNSADISNVTLNAWLQHNPDAADTAESSADYTKQLSKGDTTLVVPEVNSERTQADTQKLRESQALPIQWQRKNALPGYYAVDDWTCTAPEIVIIKVDGKDSETWLPDNPVTFTPDKSRDGFGRVTLQDGTVTTCKVTFHTAQITLLTHGLAGKDLSKITGDNTLQAKPSTSDSSATQSAAVASSTGGETLSAANTAFVKPGVKHTLGAPKMVGNAIFKGWQYYKGNNPNAPEMNDDSKWLDVANETITLKKDKHLVYRAVYVTVVVPDLPHTGGTAADWFILGGTGLGLLGLMAVLIEMNRRRKAVLA